MREREDAQRSQTVQFKISTHTHTQCDAFLYDSGFLLVNFWLFDTELNSCRPCHQATSQGNPSHVQWLAGTSDTVFLLTCFQVTARAWPLVASKPPFPFLWQPCPRREGGLHLMGEEIGKYVRMLFAKQEEFCEWAWSMSTECSYCLRGQHGGGCRLWGGGAP